MESKIQRLKIIGEHDIAEALERVWKERNAAVESLHGYCHVCAYDKHKVCDRCIHSASIFSPGGDADNWEWRGVDAD